MSDRGMTGLMKHVLLDVLPHYVRPEAPHLTAIY